MKKEFMKFNGFPKKSLDFLNKIRQNNNKIWFEDHKLEYEKLIKNPSLAFVIEMGEHLQALEPSVRAEPKVNGSLFRIYRDVRFSADKTPIKSRIGLIFWQGRGKRLQSSSFYLHFSPDELFIAVGIRWFNKPLRDAYRKMILDDDRRHELHEILQMMHKEGFSTAPAHYKRLPCGFSKDDEFAELSLLDALYAGVTLKPEEYLFSEILVDKCYEIYEKMLPLQQWVYELSLNVEE